MSTFSKGISMFLLSVLIMALLIMVALGFMLGFAHPLPWVLVFFVLIIPFIHDKIVAKHYLHWDSSMDTGIELIDNDHKKLLGLINQLQTATRYQIDDTMIENTLNELIEYTKYHFDREEQLMQINQYPGYEAHKELHKLMIKKVSQFIEGYTTNKVHTIDDTLVFLKGWLVNHIKGKDKDYVPYLKIKTLE